MSNNLHPSVYCNTLHFVTLNLIKHGLHVCLGDLGGVVEVQDAAVAVVGLVDEVEHDLHHGVQELAGQVLGLSTKAQWEDILVSLPGDVQVLLLQKLSDVEAGLHGAVSSE